MVVVAIAGGTGNVGRTIVETLIESAKHRVIVLGRGESSSTSTTAACLVVVNYTDVDATAQLLKQHQVHTVISTIQVANEDTSVAEVNLIKAAELAGSVKRFIASGWGALPNERSPAIAFQRASDGELRKTKLEWTRFVVGFFLDYYGIPYIKTHLPPMSFAVDMANKKAAIPGTGEELIALTYSFDLAKFVTAFLDLSCWEEVTYCYGEKTTWNAFIEVAENVIGSRFEVTYDPIEKLLEGKVTELPSHKKELAMSPFPEPIARQLLAILGVWSVGGQFDIPIDKALNQKFPKIRPMSVYDMLLYRQKAQIN
ncbi:Oxidoreductase BOA1-like protein [Cladobotryum mycophilum]|uniref:Oxidoreductase BOA1-like protein n=1 Tax=Cladobotryum mycophilum TaxID=491253 RepID=A0ABR0SRI9_9HYPO